MSWIAINSKPYGNNFPESGKTVNLRILRKIKLDSEEDAEFDLKSVGYYADGKWSVLGLRHNSYYVEDEVTHWCEIPALQG